MSYADQLGDVFAKLPSDIQNQHEEHEISVWFVIAAALLGRRRAGAVVAMEPDLTAGIVRARCISARVDYLLVVTERVGRSERTR